MVMDDKKKLTETIEDLELSLEAVASHGDFIENQLIDSNTHLNDEIAKRRESESRLSSLVELLSGQKDDLEILIGTIVDHSDENDYQWIDKLSQAEEDTYTDALTQINNRRKFDETLKDEWQRAYRGQTNISVMILDIDHFKLYNDYYGHVLGDDALRKVAKAINDEMARSSDIFCRYGGEEFAIVLPETDLVGAFKVAEKINKLVEKLEILHFESTVSDFITVSIGVDTITPSDSNGELLFVEHVDRLLYEAKNNGRNQVVSSEQCPDTKPKQVQTYFDFISPHTDHHKENLVLNFIPSTISINQRWRNNGLSADFLADYVSTFFPVLDDDSSQSRSHEIKSSVSFIANELLENVMKYTAKDCKVSCGINLFIYQESLVFYATNFITDLQAAEYKKFITKLVDSDPMELFMDQLEFNALNDEASGLGYLTMVNDYEAKLSWQFETNRMDYVKVVGRVELSI